MKIATSTAAYNIVRLYCVSDIIMSIKALLFHNFSILPCSILNLIELGSHYLCVT